ncbi:extracellular solute-binding protein [Orbus sturtevantii]|uniref:extracellular solute-binding protein n=1 Tax=Orbus sturtevantii TaxID=3074109 RepID=UPI00370D4506
MFAQRNKKSIIKSLAIATLASLFLVQFASAEQRTLGVYNWAGQIGKNTLSDFQKTTDIKVNYDVFDSNEALETKLIVGNTGFDVVSPSDSFLSRQIESDIYLPLDKSKLPNLKNLDPNLMKAMQMHDPDNTYAIPYVFMTTGIGYNVDMVKQRLGEDAPVDSWELVFNPKYADKLKDCGVAFLDAPTEILASALRYLGKDPNSENLADYDAAYNLLVKIRPDIRYFHSFRYIDDLANGNICVVLGWSGDVLQAKDRAQTANNKINIDYKIPKEGGLVFFDTFAIPKDSKNVAEAHEFLNFIMRPDIAAQVTNDVNFASANQAATAQFVKPEIRNNPAIYPEKEMMDKLFSLSLKPLEIEDKITDTWARFISAK